ncbi:MAG: cysteine rich repeat-containing protein [Hyphomicrobiales bacterium]|nr:cysteine rich repeat-containing protein [Hyphomicrobiales bacterium]MBV8769272.1 cysteine rich repeat-containing protein [Hyphomicrobiales bacterium]MBV9053127.1 cysteine rich repeat-containing protein [Hyphomicrobiales bacterium]MBV9137142.1 cysteine rich repeat-containing protein [Hyphomicrobiales bacterium]MBV9590179.1 cysteine rich repeat-containing protein [Hyphomicrobiales bacterium]
MVKTTVIAALFSLSALPAAAATIPFHSVREGPCKVEVERFCEHEKPGGGRIQACLREHVSDLSKLCVKGLRAYRNSLNLHLKSRRHARRDPLFSNAARHPAPAAPAAGPTPASTAPAN